MTDNTTIYALHWVVVAAMLAVGLVRGRSILHPVFVLAAIFTVHISDFLVRGYDLFGHGDEDLLEMPTWAVHQYQVSMLLIFLTTVVLAACIRSDRVETALASAWNPPPPTRDMLLAIEAVGIAIVLAEVAKRLHAVGGDAREILTQMLNARGERIWDQEHFTGNFVYAIINIVQPMAAFAFAYVVANASGVQRLRAVLAYCIVMAIIITDAHRTQAAIALAALAGFLLLRPSSLKRKVALAGAFSLIGAVVMSVMLAARGAGFTAEALERGVFYHQDDSYYRAIWAQYVSDSGHRHWNAATFIWTNAVNPIPRALWPDKPLLDVDFWGDFKLFYVTTLYIGEIVAMAGTTWMPLFAVGLGLLVYVILYASASLLVLPLGLAGYLLVALYVYMIARSSQNLTHYIYLPLFGVCIIWLLNRLATSRRPRLPAAPSLRLGG